MAKVIIKKAGISGDKAETLDGSYYRGCGSRGGKEREVVAIAYTLQMRCGKPGGQRSAYPDGKIRNAVNIECADIISACEEK